MWQTNKRMVMIDLSFFFLSPPNKRHRINQNVKKKFHFFSPLSSLSLSLSLSLSNSISHLHLKILKNQKGLVVVVWIWRCLWWVVWLLGLGGWRFGGGSGDWFCWFFGFDYLFGFRWGWGQFRLGFLGFVIVIFGLILGKSHLEAKLKREKKNVWFWYGPKISLILFAFLLGKQFC